MTLDYQIIKFHLAARNRYDCSSGLLINRAANEILINYSDLCYVAAYALSSLCFIPDVSAPLLTYN